MLSSSPDALGLHPALMGREDLFETIRLRANIIELGDEVEERIDGVTFILWTLRWLFLRRPGGRKRRLQERPIQFRLGPVPTRTTSHSRKPTSTPPSQA